MLRDYLPGEPTARYDPAPGPGLGGDRMVTPKTSEPGGRPTAAGASIRFVTPGVLLALAAVGWWWSAQMADDMTARSASSMGMDGMESAGAISLGGERDEHGHQRPAAAQGGP